MTFDKIQAVLESCGRSDCMAFFKEQEIGDEQLASLTLEDLKEIGVDKLGHRKAILSAIQAHLLTPSVPQKASLPQEVEPTGQETNVVPQGKPKIFLSYGRRDAKLHRIWSTDWWHDPEKQIRNLKGLLSKF